MTTKDTFHMMGITLICYFILTVLSVVIIVNYINGLEKEIKFNNEQIKQIANSNMEANIWMNTHGARISYIIEKQEANRPVLEKKDISVGDSLLCDYYPFEYNFHIEAIGVDKYVGYKNPFNKKMETITYQEIVDHGCYEVGIQGEDEPPLDNEKE